MSRSTFYNVVKLIIGTIVFLVSIAIVFMFGMWAESKDW